ncbi:MAG TPA: hypothetical protein VN038_22335, partial [Dyadobacter sp.]|nr:hypothetical protein [Dyadobacter sp.]
SGLDKLSRELSEAQKALGSLDGNLATVKFNPHDSASIEEAIQTMEAAITDRIRPYSNNVLVRKLVGPMKAKYRQAILDKAEELRLQSE